MAGLGRKTFSPGDVLTSSDVQGYLMDQAVMVFAGTAARTAAIPSPSAGMVAYSTATSLQVYNGSAWVDASTGYGSASGGASSTAISVAGTAYTMLTFTADATLTVSKAGLFDVLLVGGGGGAGANGGGSQGIGGGGAGGLAVQTIFLNAATYSIDIGAGGAQYTSGLTTRLISTDVTSLSGTGGGKGGGFSSVVELVGDNGGCGGGGASGIAPRNTAGLGLQGFSGGTGTIVNGNGGGGGGGATAAGAIPVLTAGGNGGAGYDASTFRGEAATTTYYAGGGGGGGASGGTGGVGGGGNRGVAGTANTGGGGGGNTTIAGNNGAAGGSGIALIRFKS
jgi:hypothetical protein